MTHAAGVMIDKMHLRGDTRHKNALLHSLDSQSWLGEDDESIIFIQKIHVQGYWWELGQKLAQAANEFVSRANHYAAINPESDVIRFNNRAQLAAHLIINLLENKSTWYQASWLAQAGVKADPVELLVHQVFDIPDILHLLEQHRKLDYFFAACGVEGCYKIARALLSLGQPGGQQLDILLSRHESDSGPDNSIPLELSVTQQRWIVIYLSAGAARTPLPQTNTAVMLVIALLSLWKFQPQQLRSAELIARRFDAVRAVYTQLIAPHRDTGVITRRNQVDPVGIAPAAQTENFLTAKITIDKKLNPAGKIPVEEPLLPTAEIALPEQWLIQHCGFFFLLNYLRHSNLGEKIPATVSPWLWFAQLVRKLSAHWLLPVDENLQALLRNISQLTHGDEESSLIDTTSDDAADAPVLEFLRRKLTALDLWSPVWICMNARVTVEQAYIHIYLDQSAVRLDVRMAGLDVNPGWVPWLGRVIYFHYGNYPELVQPPVKL